MKPAVTFSIDPFQLQQDRGSLDSLEARFTNFWGGSIDYPTRIIVQPIKVRKPGHEGVIAPKRMTVGGKR